MSLHQSAVHCLRAEIPWGCVRFPLAGVVQTIARYKLPVVIIVMNNSGVYGGDRRGEVADAGYTKKDPAPTDFVPDARYDKVMEALGGKGYYVTTGDDFAAAVKVAFQARQPSLINVVVDPFAGVESGRMTHKN